MRLDAGNVLLLLLLSGFVAGVTAPVEQGLPNPGDGTDAGPVVPKGDVGVCPAQCQVQGSVMVCHHADGLNLIQLAQCVNTMRSLSVVELRALKDMCSCSLLDYVRLTANAKVITFSPTPCGITLLKTCIPMLPDRGQKIRRRGLVAGLVMEQDDVGWRKATKRHLSWLWNKVNALYPTAARTRYRALVIKTVRSVYWKEGGVKPGGEDRILPFMVYKDGHMGPLYGGGRMGWFPVHDFQPSIQAAMSSKWMSVEDFKNLLREEVNPEDLDKDGIILKNTLDKPVKARIELKMEKITEKKDKEQGNDKEDEPPPLKERPREFFKETDDLDAETKTEVIQPTVEGSKAVFTFDDGVNSQRDGDTSKPTSKRLIAIVIVVCLIAALCILCIIYQLCCTADEDGKSYLRRFSENVAKIYDDHEEKKGDYGYDDPKELTHEEVERRLSKPYSKWSKDDFELAKNKDKRDLQSGEMIDSAYQTHGCGVHTPIPPDKQAEYDKVTQGKPILSSSKNILAGPGNGESWTQVNVFDIVDEQKKPGEGSTVKFAKLPKKVDSTTDKGKKGNAALGSPKKEDVFDVSFDTIGSETGKKKSEGGEAEGGGDGKKNKKGSKKKKSKKDEKEGGTTSAESEKEGKPEKKKKDSKKKDKKDKDGEAGDDNKEKKKGSKKKKKGESGDEGDKKEEGGDKKKKDSKKKKKGEGGDDKDKKDGDKKDSKKKSKSDKGKDEGGDKKGGKGKKGKDEGGDKKGGKEKKGKEKGTKKKRGSAPLNRSHSASSRNNSSSSRQPSREPSYSSQRRRYLLSPDDLSRQLLPLFANWPPSLYQRSSPGHRSSRSASRRQGYKRRRGERESDESNLEDTTDEDSQDSEASSDTSRSSSRSSSSIYFDPLSFPAGYVPEHPSKTRTKPRPSSATGDFLKTRSNSAAGDSAKPHHRFLSLSPDQMRRTSSQHGEENDRGAESRQRGSEAEGASPQQMAEKVSTEEADAERWRRWFEANSANLPAPKANMQKLCFGLHSDDHILGARSDARSRGQSGSPGPKEKESRKQRHDAPPPSEGPPPADRNFGGVRRSTDSESWKRWFQLDTETENKGKGTTDLIQICLGLHKESGNSTSTNSEDYHATDSGSQQDMPQTRTSTPNRCKTPSPGGLNKGSIMKKPPLALRSSRQGQSSHYSSEAEIPLTRRDSSVGRGDMQRARTPRPFEALNQEGGYPSRTDNSSSPVPIPRPRSRQELIRPASRTSDPREYTEKGTPSVPSRGGDSREGQPSVRFDVEGSEEELDFDKTFITLTSGSQSVLPSASEIERFVQTLESTSPKLFTELSSQFHKVEKEKKHLHKEDTNASRRDVTPQPSSHTWTQASSMQCDVSQQTSQFVFETPIFSFSKTKKRHVSKAQPPHTPFSPPELLPSPQRREERKLFEVRLTPTSMSSLSRAAVPADSSSGSSCYTKSASTMYSDRSSSEASMAKRTRNSRKREEELSSESQPSFYSTKTTSNQTTRSSTR
ncbi:dentin sialophosphoprotein-like isoform X2 [Littorina saxatilis]|uniref:Uncharacterized protein n=1 Tax=Littorina saxatilis TaxID=31220 RepID=A0AAN9BPT1_9CAEN